MTSPTVQPRAVSQADEQPQPARRKGAALWFTLFAMATVSFNMTRVGGWTISDLLFLASACVVIVKLLNDDQRYLTPRRYRSGSQLATFGVMIVVTGSTLSSFGSWYPLSSTMVIARLIWSALIWSWILRSVCRDRDALSSVLNAWRVTILVSSVIALLGQFGGISFNPEDFGQDRQAALTFHPGELMNFLITGLFLFIVPVFVPSQRSTRQFATAWWLVGTAIVTLAIFSTGSTSALLAVAVASVTVLFVAAYAGRSGGRRRSPLVTMALIACAGIGLTLLMSSDLAIAERLTSYGDSSGNLDDSIESRTSVNNQILGDFDQYLFVGVGPYFYGGAAESLVAEGGAAGNDTYGNVHNMHLKLLYESGLPALVGLWTVIYAVGRQSVQLVRATRGTDLYPVSLILLGGFVAVNTSAMFGPVAYARHFWLPFALISCLWAIRRRELREAADARDAVVTAQQT